MMNSRIARPDVGKNGASYLAPSVLVGWYVLSYSLATAIAKAFTDEHVTLLPADIHASEIRYMVWSTIGSFVVSLSIAVSLGWPWRFTAAFPFESTLVAVAGVCAAVVVPATTLLYSFKVPVVVSVVIMRGSVMAIGRVVDAIQNRLGLLKTRVAWYENVGTVLGVVAAVMAIFFDDRPGGGSSAFLAFGLPLWTLLVYLGAYFVRIYLMNYCRNRRRKMGVEEEPEGYFAIENAYAGVTIGMLMLMVLTCGATGQGEVHEAREAISGSWNWYAVLGGGVFGLSAVPSVLILISRGRSGTFGTVANRLASLAAGLLGTLLLVHWGGRSLTAGNWVSLAIAAVAAMFLSRREATKGRGEMKDHRGNAT